ncbi:hypothetical protein ERO13_A06G031000v2 [Gossypium hirsutum]|uniref:Uncharacterized protein isoform X1 n=3 Tax=Gossypium TaxID=3633 RepID=A0A1U8MUR9_GOSHI|nr:uncharacterized protein LOC107941552 isoform X1 [Gossypium hirsutum]KAB2076327.1 hypothetical protein ES319_A06G034000v1 [Gossypium barbadense]KAG4194033.1 hypothetical protein ERO13_A06G031000v2 [Gossypium hirsutum]TYI21395.1 hypothetical protein ES332_A06G034900v1 [Gossypium tomentosum]
MGFWEAFVELLANIFTVLCWPSFTLIYPLFVSIRIMETNSSLKNQQCLTYWVLFAFITMVELTLGNILKWFPFWPYAKGVATILLVTPYFGGASYVFSLLIRPYFIEKRWDIMFFPKKKGFVLHEANGTVGDADTSTLTNGPKSEKLTTDQGNVNISYGNTEVISTQKRVQKEWSCVLCLISTSSEYCLKEHLRGKKHKTKEYELRVGALPLKETCMLSSMPKKVEKVVLFRNLNIETWSGLLHPVTRSIRWCKWKKPEIGCVKLNTDGSVDAGNSGFGGLLRDYRGEPLCAFVCKAPQGDTFLVELWPIWRGLVLASGLGVKVIWVESDSKSVVKTINQEQPYGPKSSQCLRQIWKLLTKFENYRVTHSWRETNKAADHLSRMVLRENDVVLWPADFPDTLNSIIKDDAQGKTYLRR